MPADGEALPLAPLAHEAAQAPPGCNGLVVLPHFKGSGSPHWDPAARGAFCTPEPRTTRGEVVRAILEGIAIELKEGLDVVEQHCGPGGDGPCVGRHDTLGAVQPDPVRRSGAAAAAF